MNYHLRTPQGQDLGIHLLEELRRRRQSGELTGAEFVWCAGMANWTLLDSVLQEGAAATPPLIALPIQKSANPWLVFGIIAVIAAIFGVFLFVGLGVLSLAKRERRASNDITAGFPAVTTRSGNTKTLSAVELASQPVVCHTNTLTAEDMRKKEKEFRIRQYLEGYKNYGQHNPTTDAAAVNFLESWILCHYGTPAEQTNIPPLATLSDQLATNPACTDPLVLAVAAINAVELHEAIRRLERAVSGFEKSRHKAYPKFFATVTLATKLIQDKNDRQPVLDAAAIQHLKETLRDGSLRDTDQDVIADILIFGWGRGFFDRNTATVCSTVQASGDSFAWLALVLEGESEIRQAWQARGGGYADSVSDKGWRGFIEHLAKARTQFTKAWKLHPELPLAATRMIYVSLGDSNLTEMRLWFDRAVAAQIDYTKAWADLRWGLRPRWYGDRKAMLALGITALNTRRFDTDVPRMFFDAVSDLESELEQPPGEHIYSRREIWPHLQAMYEGYIAEPSQIAARDGWRNTFSAVAYIARKYDVAQRQLAALNWDPCRKNLTGWGVDLSLMNLEVAARTGPLGKQITEAEQHRATGASANAIKILTALKDTRDIEPRTLQFIQDRLTTLELERRLQAGEWVDFLPTEASFRGWSIERGTVRRLEDGALEVESSQDGHALYSRVRLGMEFEVKGDIETVRSSTPSFQGGLVIGLPEPEAGDWYAFRIKRNTDEGELAAYAIGWTKRQVYHPVRLNNVTNSFHLHFRPDRISAFVNGQEIFNQVKPPKNSNFSTNTILLGLGAFNDSNETVVRYRNLKVRQIVKN